MSEQKKSSDQADYTYVFNEIGDAKASVTRIERDTNDVKTMTVQVQDRTAFLIGGQQTLPVDADLCDLVGACHLADRGTPRSKRQCHIHIIMALRERELFEDPETMRLLQRILKFQTGDLYTFEFSAYRGYGRLPETQKHMLPLKQMHHMVRVSLFSGGLDSTAGVGYGFKEAPDVHQVLISVWTQNSRLQSQQRGIGRKIETLYPSCITHLPVDLRRTYPKGFKTNSILRSRGFLYTGIGSAYAHQLGQDCVYVNENGIGAFNMPFQQSEVGLDRARSVHPLFLDDMSRFVSRIFQTPFLIKNPFVFSTKVEVCRHLVEARMANLIPYTATCDRVGHGRYQCGTCSSCLLKRQALAVLRIRDYSTYSFVKRTHLNHMLRQIEQLDELLASNRAWDIIARRYPTVMGDVPLRISINGLQGDALIEKILDLYRRYVAEWKAIRHLFEHEIEHCALSMIRS